MKKTLYIVDIFSFIFRAYYAIRPLHAPDGTPVNAVYGVVSMLKKLIDTKKPDHLVVCMESKGKATFREEIYPAYKANRGAPPEDLAPQIPLIEEFVRTYPMPVLSVPGYEADDLIATLVKRFCHNKEYDVYIVSPDKDLMQLVCDNVRLFDTMKGEVMGIDAVIAKFGVPPEQVVEVQSLCGDPTDNIPGIPGIGPKTATKLIQEYGSLANVLEHAHAVKGKVGEKLAAGRDSALLSQKLVSLEHDVPLHITWADMEIRPADQGRLNDFFKRLGFRSLVTAEAGIAPERLAARRDPAEFITITDIDYLRLVLDQYRAAPQATFTFDTETDGLDSVRAQLVGISFCFEPRHAYYVPVGHKTGMNLLIDEVRPLLNPILSDPAFPKAAQNAKFDINVLSRYGFTINGLSDDTMIASYLNNPDGSHALETLAASYLGHAMIAFADVVKRGQTFADVDIPTATRYSAEDAWAAHALLEDLHQELEKNAAAHVYRTLEVPLIPILSEMERYGVLIDRDLLEKLGTQFGTRLAELEKEICALAGCEFNINSTRQLGEILFDRLKLPVIKKTKTGYSTDVEVLKALAFQHDLPKLLLEYRSLSKLQSTYIVQLRDLIHPVDGRIHTTYNQAVVATGRLSSSDPNLQNIPIKTAEGRRLRALFIAPPGSVIVSADYSQIELRLLAAFSGDPQLVEAYRSGQDVHRKTASRIFGIDIGQISDRHRAIGKTINFGVIYGQSPFGLSQMLGIPTDEAKRFINRFYEEFGGVYDYREHVLREAKAKGYVCTHLGRRRYLPELNSRNRMNQMNAERAAFNAIFQGSAADLIKLAMLRIHARFVQEGWRAKLILQVHDELVFEVPEAELDAVSNAVSHIMSKAFDLIVPLEVSLSHGRNWGEAH